MTKRPLPVTIISWVYILVGAFGFAFHVREIDVSHALQFDALGVELVRLAAVVAGAFMLRGHNWARWLAIAWIVFHVVISALNSLTQMAVHAVFCALIAWFLLRPEATRYFRGTAAG